MRVWIRAYFEFCVNVQYFLKTPQALTSAQLLPIAYVIQILSDLCRSAKSIPSAKK